jgi:hypothetical protein
MACEELLLARRVQIPGMEQRHGENVGGFDLAADSQLRHYLRNRLNALSLCVQVLIRYPAMPREDVAEYLEQICQAADDVIGKFPPNDEDEKSAEDLSTGT